MADNVTALEGQELQDLLQSLYGETETEEKEEDPNVPFTGEESVEEGGYYPNRGRPDRMETPILDEEKDNPIIVDLVESDTYKNAPSSLARQRLIDEALQEQNMEIY